ncbi:MAG: hypothetical protein M3R17_06975, partial [Bacteroidota bacterium]|nr:hypothetical protein [Bacteroidota bacterium]
MRLPFFFAGILFAVFSHAQILMLPKKHIREGERNNYFVTYQFGYSNSPVGKTFGAKGCMSTIGFNPAAFFSNTLVIGI